MAARATRALYSLTVSGVVLAIAVASGFYGPLGDALGRTRVMVGASAVLALPTLACAAAPSFGALVALRVAQGLLIPGVSALSVAWVGDHLSPGQVGPAVGRIIAASVAGGLAGRGASALYLAFYYLGGTLGSSLPGLAWQRAGWPGVVAASLGALALSFAAVTVLCRPPSRAGGRPGGRPGAPDGRGPFGRGSAPRAGP